jgi:LysM repeat protein
MLNPNAVYIGAGVATSGKSTYYTVDTGYYVGSIPSATKVPGVTPVSGTTGVPGPTVVAYDPFVISTPREDGAIIHVVGYGQTLIEIANTYDVSLEDLYRYNGYSKDEIIYPNEWVIIKPAGENAITATSQNPEVTVVPTKTERAPRLTHTPRKAQSTRPVVIFNPTPTSTIEPVTVSEEQEPLIVGVVILSLGILVGVIFYGLLNRK